MSTLRLIKRVSQAVAATSVVYIGGIWYASNHPSFEKYVPLSHTVIDFLEEREYSNQITSQARRAVDKETERLNSSFYYRKISPPDYSKASSKPFAGTSDAKQHPNASNITSAVSPSPNVSALTSRLDEEFSDEDRHKSKSSRNDATSAQFSKDPLAPSRFFDAVSGTVGRSREYLPLVLLPDEHDDDVNQVAMSLNSLISNINNVVVTEESIVSVKSTLEELARKKANAKPHYANALLVKAQDFDNLYLSYKLLWDEYLDNQNSHGLTPVSGENKVNPVVNEYMHKMCKEITDTEMLLVKLVNSKKDMELTHEEKDREFQSDYYQKSHNLTNGLKDISKQQVNKSESLVSSSHSEAASNLSASASGSTECCCKSKNPQQKPAVDPSVYGALKPSDLSFQLELALTLLVNALQQQSSVPLGPYIQQVREAVELQPNYQSYSSLENQNTISTDQIPSDRKALISEALKTVYVPDNVDLKPILDDILANYSEK